MLENWLRPLSKEILPIEQGKGSELLCKHITIFQEKQIFPNLSEANVILLGVDSDAANKIRRELYHLSHHFAGVRIVDGGNLRKNDPDFVAVLCKELLDSKLFPILLGADGHSFNGLFKAYQSLNNWPSLAVVDSRFRFQPSQDSGLATDYLHDIIKSPKSKLAHAGFIGYQSHYCSPKSLQYLEQHLFDMVRLGKARAQIAEIEPILRDADLMAFDIGAVRGADAPGQMSPSPVGFFGEEMCQLCRYAGMSDKLSGAGFFGLNPEKDERGQTAQLMAQMIWYLLEGLAHRKQDYPVSTDGLVEYLVESKDAGEPLVFWKSTRSGRWWMQVPVKSRKKAARHRLVPCSYNDYLAACSDELPDRLINALRRFT